MFAARQFLSKLVYHHLSISLFPSANRYYNVSDTWINWTSMIFMIIYIPLIFPASWFLDKMVCTKTNVHCFVFVMLFGAALRWTAYLCLLKAPRAKKELVVCLSAWRRVNLIPGRRRFGRFCGFMRLRASNLKLALDSTLYLLSPFLLNVTIRAFESERIPSLRIS